MISSPARDLRDLLAAAAAKATSDEPLRLLVERRAPLTSQGERLGFLDTLLRVSCHGDGHCLGVLVFDWPQAAHGHSVVRLLERWRDREGQNGELEVECREGSMSCNGSGPAPSLHLKVHFDAARAPDAMGELLDLACRVGVLKQAREELAPRSEVATASTSPTNGHGASGHGKDAPEPAGRPPHRARSAEEQRRIDQIVNHAAFDSELHPHVNPNEEVVSSTGDVFRLIFRRSRGEMRRQWLRVGRAPATASH